MKLEIGMKCVGCNGELEQIDVPENVWEYEKLYFFKCIECGEEYATPRKNPNLKGRE